MTISVPILDTLTKGRLPTNPPQLPSQAPRPKYRPLSNCRLSRVLKPNETASLQLISFPRLANARHATLAKLLPRPTVADVGYLILELSRYGDWLMKYPILPVCPVPVPR